MNEGGSGNEPVSSIPYPIEFFCSNHDVESELYRKKAPGGKKTRAPNRKTTVELDSPSLVSLGNLNESDRWNVGNGFTSVGICKKAPCLFPEFPPFLRAIPYESMRIGNG